MTDEHGQTSQAHADEPTAGIFDAPSGALLTAIARNKAMIALCAVAVAIVGVAYGVHRRPTYTASTTIQVGTISLSSPGFDGFVVAASSLATVFARTIEAEPVLDQLHTKLNVTPGDAARRLSAAPIPDSPSFRIVATGASAAGAMRLANATSEAVISYERGLAGAKNPQEAGLLREYGQAAERLQQANATVEQLSTERDAQRARMIREGKTPSSSPSPTLVKARIVQSEALLRANAIDSSYRNLTVTEGGANSGGGLLSLLAAAGTTTNNRSSKIKLFGLMGLLVGLVLGCGLAAARERLLAARRSADLAKSRLRATEAA